MTIKVYVINKDGKPLMPTTPRKARVLLRDGKAKVVQRTPFTIKLNYPCGGNTQPITLGVDAGSKTIGLSATTEEGELYAAEVTLRTDVTKNLATRREFRRARRNRKTRYRKPRFQNRKKPKGWLAPTVEQKIHTHERAIADVCKILPISKIVVEVAAFDIRKIKNPDISGVEYQQGDQMGFWNVREYVLWRDNHECQCCHGKSKDPILNVHHIETRKTGGNAPNNLVTLCETCHGDYHTGKAKLNIRRGTSLRDAAFMGIMRWEIYHRLKANYPSVALTFGYITKNTCIRNGLEKSHIVDARCISGNPLAKPADICYRRKAVRTKNRQIHKATINKGGYRKLNQAPKYVFGFQLFDKVLYDGQEGFVFGRRTTGRFDIRKLNGARLSAGVSCKKLKPLEYRKTLLTERADGGLGAWDE